LNYAAQFHNKPTISKGDRSTLMEKPTDEGSDDKNDVEGKASAGSNEEVGDQAVFVVKPALKIQI
jgi:hypothetical protein